MNSKRLVTVSAVCALATAGAVGAVAATKGDEGKKTEDAILANAAKQLNVSPDALRDALSKAEDEQLDQAVKDGKLTQEQADEIKKFREKEGRVLGIPPHGGPPGFHGHFFGPGGRGAPGFGLRSLGGPEVFDNVAKALGMSREDFFEQLRKGKSLSQIAKAKGKSLEDVEKAVKTSIAKDLDKEVKAGRLTDKQRDEILKHFSLRFERGGLEFRGRFGPGGRHFRGGRPPFMPGAPDEPGTSVAPAPAPSPQI